MCMCRCLCNMCVFIYIYIIVYMYISKACKAYLESLHALVFAKCFHPTVEILLERQQHALVCVPKYLNYHNKQYNQKHNELIKPLETNTENHTNSSNDGVLSITVNCMQPLLNIIDRICCTQKRKQPEQLLSTGSCTIFAFHESGSSLAVHWASQLDLGGVLDAQQLLMATRDIYSDCKRYQMTIK